MVETHDMEIERRTTTWLGQKTCAVETWHVIYWCMLMLWIYLWARKLWIAMWQWWSYEFSICWANQNIGQIVQWGQFLQLRIFKVKVANGNGANWTRKAYIYIYIIEMYWINYGQFRKSRKWMILSISKNPFPIQLIFISFYYICHNRLALYTIWIRHLRRPHLAWVASGVLNRCSAVRMVCYGQKSAIRVAALLDHNIAICMN